MLSQAAKINWSKGLLRYKYLTYLILFLTEDQGPKFSCPPTLAILKLLWGRLIDETQWSSQVMSENLQVAVL